MKLMWVDVGIQKSVISDGRQTLATLHMTCADGKVVVQAQNDKPYTIRMVNRHVCDVVKVWKIKKLFFLKMINNSNDAAFM